MFGVLEEQERKENLKKEDIDTVTGTFLRPWVSISEAGIKMGHRALRKIVHINSGSAQGTGQQLRSAEPGSEKRLRLRAASAYWRVRNEIQT